MKEKKHTTIYRSDYRVPTYSINTIHLEFLLDPRRTVVIAQTEFVRMVTPNTAEKEIRLDGDGLILKELFINGVKALSHEYRVDEKHLVILDPPEKFILKVVTEINPEENKALSGLYRSSNNFCTQCEAEGFRRITYYLDRPDVLARFTTKIIGDRNMCPVMLSNGNLIEKGEVDGNKHYTIWQDPFPKPSYLFALVAGDLYCFENEYVTKSGRKVILQIFVEKRNRDKCEHAMISLKKAMKWDEDVYNLEYDLDTYMIVAVDDFNMGAMENKGLNVFNSKYVLASPRSATDQDYLGIEGVIAHEYFHNWTGNRVTCRDWFQLSLKEGLTVFRDQEFSAEMNSRSVKRISDVNILRNSQFREDAGPMAHPVRPDSFVEINNFYTVTVYNKGAEVIRMLRLIIGDENYQKGIKLYFERFDGMAVTCEDFVKAMEDASGISLEQFRLWYSQSGTPELRVSEDWDEKSHEFNLTIEQRCDPTPGQRQKKPFHIPVMVGLIHSQKGEAGEVRITGEKSSLLQLRKKMEIFSFSGVSQKPLVSFLRGFSAPVKVEIEQSRDELAFLMSHDSDLFNRWDAAIRYSSKVIFEVVEELRKNQNPAVDSQYLNAFKQCLTSESDPALIAQALTLPSDGYLAQQMKVVDPDLLGRARLFLKAEIARSLEGVLFSTYQTLKEKGSDSIDADSMGKRSLKNCCLSYIATGGDLRSENLKLAVSQYHEKSNMTDRISALAALTHLDCPERDEALSDFYAEWKDEPLVVDKWLTLQAMSSLESTLSRVKGLLDHEAFNLENPNKVRSLIGAFCAGNHYRFHQKSGAGYRFLSSMILRIDKKNPQVASRLVSPLISYSQYSQKLKVQMHEQLRFILMQDGLSADVFEIVNTSIK